MLNGLWFGMILFAVAFGANNGTLTEVVNAVTEYAKLAFDIALGLTGIMTFWLGLMKIAERSGLMNLISKGLAPVMRWLVPDVPASHPAIGAIVMNISANMLGLANAATPLGLKAMEELQDLNEDDNVATDAMCMFLAINTSSVQLIPATAIAYLSANGASDPTSIIVSSLLATLFSTIVGVSAAKVLAKMRFFKRQKQGA